MFRLLALLQLTRAALAFTAIADAWAVLLLRAPEAALPANTSRWMTVMVIKMLIMSVVSAGLYGFGMSLNDLLDARRDRIFARWRPIPSGRIGARMAIVVSMILLLIALLAAAMLDAASAIATATRSTNYDWYNFIPWQFLFAIATASLIVFYDGTAKYLGGIGILTLGVIRALHCLIANPKTPLLFPSMFLVTHVSLVTLIAYHLENKRPRLKRRDYLIVLGGLAAINTAAAFYMHFSGTLDLTIWPMLTGPIIAMAVFALWATRLLLRRNLSPRQKGERLMLMGLFWLFVYDAGMLLTNGQWRWVSGHLEIDTQWRAGLAVIGLFVCALISFFALRTLGRRMSQPRLAYRLERPGGTPHA